MLSSTETTQQKGQVIADGPHARMMPRDNEVRCSYAVDKKMFFFLRNYKSCKVYKVSQKNMFKAAKSI